MSYDTLCVDGIFSFFFWTEAVRFIVSRIYDFAPYPPMISTIFATNHDSYRCTVAFLAFSGFDSAYRYWGLDQDV